MKPEKVKLRVRLGGRSYVFDTLAPYEPLIRRAVARLNDRFHRMQSEFGLDETDILAMLLLEEVAQREKENHEYQQQLKQWEQLNAETEQLINDIDQTIDEIDL